MNAFSPALSENAFQRGAFGVPAGGSSSPLDGTPAAAGAWSVARRLFSTYTGPLIRVQTDDGETAAEMDVNALPNGALDSTSMIAWADGKEARVITVYDQSGNGRNMESLTTWPPLIVQAFGVPVMNAGKPAMRFASSDALAVDGAFIFGALTLFSNAAGVADGGYHILWDLDSASRFLAFDPGGQFYIQGSLGGFGLYTNGSNQLLTCVLSSSPEADEVWDGGNMVASGEGSGGLSSPSYLTWGNNAGGIYPWSGVASELVVYSAEYGSAAPATHAAIAGGLAL